MGGTNKLIQTFWSVVLFCWSKLLSKSLFVCFRTLSLYPSILLPNW